MSMDHHSASVPQLWRTEAVQRGRRFLVALAVLPALVVAGAPASADPPPTIAVDTIGPPQGFNLVAPELYKNAFQGMEGSGDINGDGIADIVMLNWRYKRAGVAHLGRVAVVFGTDEGFPADVDMTTLDGTNGFVLSGAEADQRLGLDAAFIGDVNGDGFDDLAVNDDCAAIPCPDLRFIFFGRADFDRRYVLRKEKTGPHSYIVLKSFPRRFADSGRAVGDVNADGFDDVAFTLLAPWKPRPENIGDARCVVMYGRERFVTGLNIREPKSGRSFAFVQDGKDCAGIHPAGDFDADGFTDMSIFGPGETFPIVYGKAADMPLFIGIADPTPGVRTLSLTQSGGGNRSEVRTSTLVGPFQAGQATSVFVFPLQQPSSSTATTVAGAFVSSAVTGDTSFSLDSVDGTNGARFVFDDLPDIVSRFQYSVTSGGDFNGDGLSDPLLCWLGSHPSYDSKCLLLFGRPGAFPSEVRWSAVDEGEGLVFAWKPLFRQPGETFVTSLGDVNGDGLADLYFQGSPHKATVVFGTDAYN
jgi:hypothetical protein